MVFYIIISMKKFFKAVGCFVIIMAIIVSYAIVDIFRTIKITIVVTGVLQGNVISFKASGEPYKGALVGGMPFLVSKIKELRKAAAMSRSSFFVIDCGDDFPGTSQSFYSQCRVIVDTLNLAGISALSLGNREFDYGFEVLKARAKEARFPILGANLRDARSGKPFDDYFRERAVLETPGGFKIGVLGLAPPETITDSSTKNIAGISFAPETEVVSLFMARAVEEKLDFTVAVTQVDLKKDRRLLEPYIKGGLDMVIGFDFYNEISRIAPLGNTLVVPLHGLSKGTEITKVNLVFDSETHELIEYSMEKIPIFAQKIEPDPECTKVIADYMRKLDAIMNEVIGRTESELKRPFNEETNFGNLVCDYLLKYSSAEISLQNSGSFRADIGRGDITVGNVYDALPFDNDLVVVEIEGSTLADIINTCCAKERGLLQIGGGSYSYNPNAASSGNPSGSFTDKAVLTGFRIGSSEIEFGRKYRVATNSFLASGQGGYPQFKKCRQVAILEGIREVVEKSFRSDRNINPKVEGRIKRSADEAPVLKLPLPR